MQPGCWGDNFLIYGNVLVSQTQWQLSLFSVWNKIINPGGREASFQWRKFVSSGVFLSFCLGKGDWTEEDDIWGETQTLQRHMEENQTECFLMTKKKDWWLMLRSLSSRTDGLLWALQCFLLQFSWFDLKMSSNRRRTAPETRHYG